jgi:phage shock protein A
MGKGDHCPIPEVKPMASLLEKVGTLISANLHALVDQALKANSLAVIDQYIRQVNDNLEALTEAAATVGGEVKTLRRKQAEYEGKAAELDRNIDVFLQEGKEELAAAAQSKLNSTQRLVESYRAQADRQQEEYQKLLDAKLKLEAKLTTIRQEQEELQALLELAQSKELTAKAIRSLDDLVGSGDVDVARVAESIRARLDRASMQTEMLSSRLDEQMDEILERREIDAQLAERKRRLGLS